MKAFIYIIVSFLVSFPCSARWEKTHVDKIYTEYLEVDTVKKIDDTIFIWSLMDYREPQKNGNLSTKYYSMYDCVEMKYKVLSIIEYKTNMGKGRNFKYTKNITNESNDENWIYPSIDSTDYIKINSICGPS